MQFEVPVLEQETADPTEIDRREKIFQVEVEDPPAVAVLSGVGDDRPLALEAVGRPVLAVVGSVNFVDAVLQEVGQLALQNLQCINRCLDRSLPTVSFGNLEGFVLHRRWLFVQDVRDSLRL